MKEKGLLRASYKDEAGANRAGMGSDLGNGLRHHVLWVSRCRSLPLRRTLSRRTARPWRGAGTSDVDAALPPLVPDLAGPHDVDEYVQYALGQNAGIQAAKYRVLAAGHRVPQEASLKDPMVDLSGLAVVPQCGPVRRRPHDRGHDGIAGGTLARQVEWTGRRGGGRSACRPLRPGCGRTAPRSKR